MNRIGWTILATLCGLLAGGVVVGMVEAMSSLMHPMPADLDRNDVEQVRGWVSTLPISAMFMLLAAWCSGCTVGGWVARRLSVQRSSYAAMIVVTLFTLATVSNLILLPHPSWMWIAGPSVCLIGGLLGGVLASPACYTVSTQRQVWAPLHLVFQTLSRVEEFKEAIPAITEIEFLTPHHNGLGARFCETRIMNGKAATTELEVAEFVENDRVRMLASAGGTLWDTLFTVSSSAEVLDEFSVVSSPTTITMTMDATPTHFWAKIMVPMILPMVAKAVEGDMDAVKAYCESKRA